MTAFLRRPAASWLLVFVLAPGAGAAEFDGTLLDAVTITVQQQSSVAISKQSIVAGEGQLLNARSTFETNVNAGVSGGRTFTPIAGLLPGATPAVIDSHVTSYQTGVTQKMRSGITVNAAIAVTRIRDNSTNLTAPSFGNVALTFTFPLLKGSGTRVNTASEVAAQVGIDAATAGFRDAVSTAIVRTVFAYWDYLAAQRLLDVSVITEDRAKTLLDEARKLAKGDEIPKSDILKYEAKLVRDRATRVGAEQDLREARAVLVLAMGLSGESTMLIRLPRDDFPDIADTGLALLNDPATVEALSRLALRRRFDLRAAEYRLNAAESLLGAARVDDKSRLDLTSSIGYNGLVEGRTAAAGLSAFQYVPKGPNVFIGLNYVLPVSNYENRGLITQRAAAAEQARLERDALIKTIRANLNVRFNSLRATSLQLEQAQAEVEIQTKVYDNEKKRYRLGVATVLDLLTAESQLTAAQVTAVNAQRNFAQALIGYRAETGTLLDGTQDRQSIDKSRLTTLPGRSAAVEEQ